MTDQHPITPPPELVQQWIDNDDFPFSTGTFDLVSITKDRLRSIATSAARWGADQELEACCEILCDELLSRVAEELRAARRPKPPSLKESALEALDSATYQPGTDFKQIDPTRSAIIRRALEALPE